MTLGTGVSATQTLVADRANYTLFVQRVVVYINTDAAQSLTFQDSNGSPVEVAKVSTSPGVDTRWDFDFGDRGLPLTQGNGLVLVPSGAGLGAQIEWLGYQRLTGVTGATTIDRTV